MIAAGTLRHRGTIQERVPAGSPATSSSGEAIDTWADVATTWMSIEPIRGREFFSAEQVQSAVDVRIRMRYREGITSKMRIVVAGVPYNIVSVIDPEERHVDLEIMCERGLSDG